MTGKSQTQINTEKVYWFRKACEEAYRKRNKSGWQAFKNSFKNEVNWWSLQIALELIELYEESNLNDLKKISQPFQNKLFQIKETTKSQHKTFRNLLKNEKN